ncbi:MAG: ATP-grasp domain-containing protein [Bacteroidaceae bacterium]|nr:ATP-grasp domain-containing protein [Bacteroidaceae bacterium]
MTNLLLLGSGTQAFAVEKSLFELRCRIFVVVSETGNYGDCSKYVHKLFVCNKLVFSDSFLEHVKYIIVSEGIDVVLPMGDVYAEFLSKNKEELSQLTHIQIPDYDIFMKGYDKNQLMSLCNEKGFPHPLTIDLSKTDVDDKSSFKKFPFPGLLKPNCTTGGRGMTLITDYENLCQKYPSVHKKYGECHLQRFIREGGRQIKVQLYIGEDGSLVVSSVLDKVRWYPVKGGSSCCSVTVRNDRIVKICHKILKDLKWIGFADFDTIEDPDTGELLIMEINPRLPACIGAAVCAGIDWGEVLFHGALGKSQNKYEYREGVVLRHLGFDFLWFFHSHDRWMAKPSWFHFFGDDVHYQDFHFDDQKPFWTGTYHNIKKLFDPSFKNAKSGTSAK